MEQLPFNPRARIMLQLGNELIRNESIALLELVKNAYDADATMVSITMEKVDDQREGIIIIKDDGTGMDIDVIKNVWMQPGSDYRAKQLENNSVTEKFKRLPLGEKGIGRFAVHKLGNLIELVTRKYNSNEIYIIIDWDKFSESKLLNEVRIDIHERKPEVFMNANTGTMILLRNIRKSWKRGDVRNVFRALNSLCSPFDTTDSFKVNFKIDNEDWLEGLSCWESIKQHALFKFSCIITGNNITRFQYEFTPWPAMKRLKYRKVTEKDWKNFPGRMVRDKEEINLSPYQIGTVRFEGLMFDREAKILSLGMQDKKGFKEYLNANGGIRIYRDGIRVYNYGEPGNDWLDLNIRRVNTPVKRISNNIIIAAVSISRKDSTELIEKTNREGFVENEAYYALRDSLLYALNLIETQRQEDKDKLRIEYGPQKQTEPVVSRIGDLRKMIAEKIKETELKEKIINQLDRIEDDYKFINETLLRSAGAGLSLSVVIHEIDKIVDELTEVVKQKVTDERVKRLISHLAKLVEGYSILVKKSERKRWKLQDLIKQGIFNLEFRLEYHNVEIITVYSDRLKNESIECARNLIVSSIMNIIDNSIWWFYYAKVEKKKIYITISDEYSEFISLVIADNGPGLALPCEEIVKPFVSAKSDGMGLGLHIVSEVMTVHGGKLIFPEPGEFSIPDEFKDGTCAVLAFRKENS